MIHAGLLREYNHEAAEGSWNVLLRALERRARTGYDYFDWELALPVDFREALRHRGFALAYNGNMTRISWGHPIDGHTTRRPDAFERNEPYECADSLRFADALKEYERTLIAKSLERAGNNTSAAARVLGINRTTLLEKMRRYGLMAKKVTDSTNSA